MTSSFPFPSVLTPAKPFEACVRPSFGRFTKLYTLFLGLLCFVDLTFAYEDRVDRGKEFADTFFFPRNLHAGRTAFDHPPPRNATAFNATSSPIALKKVVARDFTLAIPAFLEYTRPDPLYRVNYTDVYGTLNIDSADDRIIENIAQEFFFHDTEVNFYESKWWEWLNDWAAGYEHDFQVQKSRRPGLTFIEYFAEIKLGLAGLKCGIGGCKNMPSLDYIRQVHEHRLHEARQVEYTLRALERASIQVHQYAELFTRTKNDLEAYCNAFSHTFFHGATKGKNVMCPAKLIQIIMIVISVVAALSIAAVATPFVAAQTMLMPVMIQGGLLGGGVGIIGASVVTERRGPIPSSKNYASVFTPNVAERAWRTITTSETTTRGTATVSDQLDAHFGIWVDKIMSKTWPIPVGRHAEITPPYGAFGMLEGFNSSQLRAFSEGSSVYQHTDIKSGLLFRRYPKGDVTLTPPSSSEGVREASDRLVTRLERLVDIEEAPSDTRHALPRSTFEDNMMRSFVHPDGVPMDINHALDFLERNGDAINQRWQQLRRMTDPYTTKYESRVPLAAGAQPKVMVKERPSTMQWSSIISDFKFDTADRVQSNSRFKYHSSPSRLRPSASSLQKRSNGRFDPTGHLLHDLHGSLDSLSALNLISPKNLANAKAKRATDRWAVGRLSNGHEDWYVTDVQGHYFQNEIQHEKCKSDSYTGNTAKNEQACHDYLNNIVNRVIERMVTSYHVANSSPRRMSQYLTQRFSSHVMYNNIYTVQEHQQQMHDNTLTNMKNSLVSKAYADGNCFVTCAPRETIMNNGIGVVKYPDGTWCQTACYDPTERRFERLYGFGSGKATQYPWSLTENKIGAASVKAYRSRSVAGFYPGSLNLDPNVPLTADDLPVLPVCYSELHLNGDENVPCSCGDRYGSETAMFANAINTSGGGRKQEWKSIKFCLDRMRPSGTHDAAVYLLNACHVIYDVVAPPGTNSEQEINDWGHYKHNYQACQKYYRVLEEYRHAGPDRLKKEICASWARNARDFDRGSHHDRVDFSYVNDVLEDNACHREYKQYHRRGLEGGVGGNATIGMDFAMEQ